MELNNEELKEWKRIAVNILQRFHTICKENGLKYFAVGGTAIGAVRHGGIIPWDDDIDVAMPRPDYERFIELCKTIDLGDCELATPWSTPGYPLPFIKMCNHNTTLIEERERPYLIGVFIDIFPLDGTSTNRTEALRLMGRYKKLWNRLEAISSKNSISEYLSLLLIPHEWGRFVMKTASFFCEKSMRRKLIKAIDTVSNTVGYDDAENVIVYSGSYNEKEIMPKSFCSGDTIEMPFDGTVINMASGYETYLRGIFGDYMQMPPVEKRVSHHYHALVDLTQRLPLNSALHLLKHSSRHVPS